MGKTVLIVDDSKLSRAMICTILKNRFPDWKILEATNAEEALEFNDSVIDIITLDVNMPGMDGIMLGTELRQRYLDADISLITANLQDSVRERADAAGFDFIAKPITEEKVFDAIGFEAVNEM